MSELTLARRKREETRIKFALERLQSDNLLEFVLLTTQKDEGGGTETLSIERSNLRYDQMIGILHQASYVLNQEMLEEEAG